MAFWISAPPLHFCFWPVLTVSYNKLSPLRYLASYNQETLVRLLYKKFLKTFAGIYKAIPLPLKHRLPSSNFHIYPRPFHIHRGGRMFIFLFVRLLTVWMPVSLVGFDAFRKQFNCEVLRVRLGRENPFFQESLRTRIFCGVLPAFWKHVWLLWCNLWR